MTTSPCRLRSLFHRHSQYYCYLLNNISGDCRPINSCIPSWRRGPGDWSFADRYRVAPGPPPATSAATTTATCAPQGDGAGELKTLWSDPEFRADQNATYYVRVLENPTCRWSTWEALKNGTPPRPDVAQTLQERAYTSPIWYASTR